MNIAKRSAIANIDGDGVVRDALKLLSRQVEQPGRRAFLQRSLTLGGYETARRVHFFAMALMVAFVAVHLLMVALVPRTLVAMLRGR